MLAEKGTLHNASAWGRKDRSLPLTVKRAHT